MLFVDEGQRVFQQFIFNWQIELEVAIIRKPIFNVQLEVVLESGFVTAFRIKCLPPAAATILLKYSERTLLVIVVVDYFVKWVQKEVKCKQGSIIILIKAISYSFALEIAISKICSWKDIKSVVSMVFEDISYFNLHDYVL